MITQQQRDLRNAVIKLLRDNLTDEPHEHVDALILVFGSVIEGIPIGDALLAHLQSRP